MRMIPIFPNKINILPVIKFRKTINGEELKKLCREEGVIMKWKVEKKKEEIKDETKEDI
jgi:hypothetical protein